MAAVCSSILRCFPRCVVAWQLLCIVTAYCSSESLPQGGERSASSTTHIMFVFEEDCKLTADQRDKILLDALSKAADNNLRSTDGEVTLAAVAVGDSPLLASSTVTLSLDSARFSPLAPTPDFSLSEPPVTPQPKCVMESVWLKHLKISVIEIASCPIVETHSLRETLLAQECVKRVSFDSTDTHITPPTRTMRSNMCGKSCEMKNDSSVNDPGYARQWFLHDAHPYSVQVENMLSGSAKNYEGSVVAIIDEGFDIDHPDLSGQWWENPDEICGNGIDDDGNGLIDDCHGWNFRAFGSGNADVSEFGYHGTSVAGIVAAASNNKRDIASVCPGCRIMALKFDFLVSSFVKALNYAVSKGVQIINYSYGGKQSATRQAALDALKSFNVLFITSAGNNNCNLDSNPVIPCMQDKVFPAVESDVSPHIVSVGAIDPSGRKSDFSNYGASRVQVYAPGSGLLTTRATGGTVTEKGTSFAAPIVTGIVGIVWHKYPQLTNEQMKQALLQGCVKKSHLAGISGCGGHITLPATLEAARRIAVRLI